MRSELESLISRKVFRPIETMPKGVNLVGCKWVFVRKWNKFGNVSWYKARLVAQGFTQRSGIDYGKMYSPIMDSITFRYLLSLAVDKKLATRLMDVVTAYLYDILNTDIYIRIPVGLVEFQNSQRQPECFKLERTLYSLKQAGRMWYKRLKYFFNRLGFLEWWGLSIYIY